jgi:2,2-dialkylglycine decarboxylase (pyruvate)
LTGAAGVHLIDASVRSADSDLTPPASTPSSDRDEGEWLENARRYLLLPRLDKADVSGPVLVAGEGSVVWDVNGKEYLDFNSGQMCSVLGHRSPPIVAAIKQACDRLIHASSSVFNIYEIELGERLASIVPPPLRRSFFLESGSDANEAAIQIAKRYTGRTEVASPHTSFHGLSDATRALTFGVEDWHRGYGPYAPGGYAFMAPYCYQCPIRLRFPDCELACLDGSFTVLDAQLSGPLAAVITEPLFSAGGVIEPPSGWLRALRRMCNERGALLIIDEAQTGLGKLGTMWAFEEDGVVPDIVTVSKHFGGGVSLSAVITTDEIADAVQGTRFVHGHSHTSDPLACAAGAATIDTIVANDLPLKAAELGAYWRARLDELAGRQPLIGDVRGRGLLQGVELVSDSERRTPAYGLGQELERWCVRDGLFLSVRRNGSVLRFAPPWTTTEEQFDRAAEILDARLSEVADGAGQSAS